MLCPETQMHHGRSSETDTPFAITDDMMEEGVRELSWHLPMGDYSFSECDKMEALRCILKAMLSASTDSYVRHCGEQISTSSLLSQSC